MKRHIIVTACGFCLAALAATPLAAQQASRPLSITPSATPSAARPAVSPPTPGGAERQPPPVAVPTIDQVNAYLNSLTQLTGRFAQIGPDGGAPKASSICVGRASFASITIRRALSRSSRTANR